MALFHSSFLAEYYSIVYMYHIFFIHSGIYGHLDFFHILVIASIAAMNTRVYVSLWIMVFSRYLPRSGIAGSYVTLYLDFIRLCCFDKHTQIVVACYNKVLFLAYLIHWLKVVYGSVPYVFSFPGSGLKQAAPAVWNMTFLWQREKRALAEPLDDF